jgi:uncharacterized membrane protein YccC
MSNPSTRLPRSSLPPDDRTAFHASGTAREREKSRLVALAIAGAIAGVLGEKVLGRLPAAAIVLAVCAAIGGVFWFFHRRRSSPGSTETLAQVVVVALVGAVASYGGQRLFERAPRLLLALLIAAIAAAALAFWRSRPPSDPSTGVRHPRRRAPAAGSAAVAVMEPEPHRSVDAMKR